ncbi:MAG TPA: hydrogenase maturation protease [Nitrospirota bacterium]|nr:hydrogenase maturation protease [Nitrospirota bacterium]
MPDLREMLREMLRGRVCVMGMGNAGYGDDAVGSYLADALSVRPMGIDVINAGSTPERFIGSVIEGGYDRLLFIDAVESGIEPAAAVLLDASEIIARFPQISTHKISVGLLAKLAEDRGMVVRLLGIQPRSIRHGAGLSEEVRKTADMLIGLIGTAVEAVKIEAA